MPDILQDFVVAAPPARVFAAIATPAGLDAWWTLRAAGEPAVEWTWTFHFGPDHDWRAVVRVCEPDRALEWEITVADADWRGTRVGFALAPGPPGTVVRFWHAGWRDANAHYRTSVHCWALYLRLLRRYVERGEVVPYDRRLSA